MSVTKQSSGGSRLPILQAILPVHVAQLPGEILGGVTLAALAMPTVMGYTKIAGMPVITGLYTILVPMALFALFCSSRHLVASADSATAVLLSAGLAGMAATASDQYVALAGLLALLVAGFLIAARILRLGFLANFLSRTVLIGFLTGVGVQVSLLEVPEMLGMKRQGDEPLPAVWQVVQHIDQSALYALAITLSVLLVILGAKRVSNKIPGALIAVIGAIAASWAFDFKEHVQVLGTVPSGLPHFGLPRVDWSWELVAKLIPTAFAMFVVILSQSAATARAYAMRFNESVDEDRDLIGLGLANIGSALSGTFVVNGSPTQTQMVTSGGGRSQLAPLFTAVIVLLILLFFTAPLAYMPVAVLSTIVFLIAISLIDIEGMRKIYVQRRSEFWVALITAATVVMVGVEQGIVLAVVLSLIEHTRHGYRPKNAILVPLRSGVSRARRLTSGAQAAPGLVIYRFTHSLYYANAQQLSDEVTALANNADPALRWLCLDASAVDDVDFSAAETLRSLYAMLEQKGIRLVIAQVLDDVRESSRYHLLELFGEDAFFDTLDDVMCAYRKQWPASDATSLPPIVATSPAADTHPLHH